MKRRLTIMKQNEKSFVMTDAAVSANTNNMEDKGMKGKFKNFKKKFIPAVAGGLMGVMMMSSTCFAAATGTSAVTQPLDNLKTLVIAVIGAVRHPVLKLLERQVHRQHLVRLKVEMK